MFATTIPEVIPAVDRTINALIHSRRYNLLVSGRSGDFTRALLLERWPTYGAPQPTIVNWGRFGNLVLYKSKHVSRIPTERGSIVYEHLISGTDIAAKLGERWSYVEDHMDEGGKMRIVMPILFAAGFHDISAAVFVSATQTKRQGGVYRAQIDDSLANKLHHLVAR